MADNLKFVQNVLEFLDRTVQVVKASFGPNGLDCLVSTTSGKMLMTNDGHAIIKSLSFGNVFGKLCYNGMVKSGNFSKKFMLLLKEMLSEVASIEAVKDVASIKQTLTISHGMKYLALSVLPGVFNDLKDSGVIAHCFEDGSNINWFMKAILRTTIDGKFNPNICTILVDILSQLLFEENALQSFKLIQVRISDVLDNFNEAVWEVPGKPFTCSTILQGVLLPRQFLTMVKILPKPKDEKFFKFVIYECAIDYEDTLGNTIFSVQERNQIEKILLWKQEFVLNIIRVFVSHNIQLVLTSKKLGETFVNACNQNSIAAIHLIPEEDIAKISQVFNLSPIFDMNDLPMHIAMATSCKSMQVGLHTYVQLMSEEIHTKQIILFAPNESFCHQYSMALKSMLRSLQSCIKQTSSGCQCFMSYVPGGGAFELAFSHVLEQYRKKYSSNTSLNLAIEILEKSLLAIPRELIRNSSCKLNMFHLKAQTRQCLIKGHPLLGIDRSGNFIPIVKKGVLEPTMANYDLIYSVLQLFIQIIQTDKVLFVKKLPSKKETEDNSSDDEDDK
ncbi:T-complex protein 1 subunit gamma-like [Xenia sp. Carnegie-2017]|uniref:T-complex protein 1 subunit gamma-like n=1 Tax=Xenia sp. Carnegie-2017 TaxID=2897299 RepID=UPI001F041FE8|nr:T-complex protein 1 subunit gamma-like [Xenia sp. Carnegie-2017]